MEATLHNEWSLILFVEYLATLQGHGTGKPLQVDTISEYVSMVRTELSVRFGFAVAGVQPQRYPHVIKALRRERPRGNRRERRGIRRRHLRAAWSSRAAFRRDDPDAVNAWAAATTAWQAVARGGEVATSRRDLKRWAKQ